MGQELFVPDTAVVSAPVVSPAPTAVVAAGGAGSNPTARLNEQRLARRHPVLAIRARCLIELCAYAGIAILTTQTLRTWEEQDGLYAQGRTRPPIGKKHIVTNAKGG